jgi:dCTP deaminase
MYSDHDILTAQQAGDIGIEPFHPEHVSGATIDLTLHSNFRTFSNTSMTHIDVKQAFDVTTPVTANQADGSFVIHPGEFVLGSTAEVVTLSNKVGGILEGRSSLGRIGLIVHATASLVKPGFTGYLTLEMSNISNLPIKLYAGMRIAQLALLELKTPADVPYGENAKYQNQDTPMASRIWKDFEKVPVAAVAKKGE